MQQQRLGGKTRCRVFLGAQEGYGWISAEGREGAPLIERHSEPGAAASPASVAGGAEGRDARSEGGAQARGAASPFSNLMRWRQASHSQLEYAFDALYHATRMMRRHRRMRITFDAWNDLRLGRPTAGSLAARMAAHMAQQHQQGQLQQAELHQKSSTSGVVPVLALEPRSSSSLGAGGSPTSSLDPSEPSEELFPDGLPPMQSDAQVEIVSPGSPEAQATLQREVVLLRRRNDALHQDLVR